MRANISVVCCFFYFLIVCLYIPFNKFQCVISFRSHIFNVRFPVQDITNCDSRVLSIFSRFQFCIVKFVWEHDWIFVLVTRLTSHLSGLNSMDQSDCHYSSLSKSYCNVSAFD